MPLRLADAQRQAQADQPVEVTRRADRPSRSAVRLLSDRAAREARQRALKLERLAASPLALRPLRRYLLRRFESGCRGDFESPPQHPLHHACGRSLQRPSGVQRGVQRGAGKGQRVGHGGHGVGRGHAHRRRGSACGAPRQIGEARRGRRGESGRRWGGCGSRAVRSGRPGGAGWQAAGSARRECESSLQRHAARTRTGGARSGSQGGGSRGEGARHAALGRGSGGAREAGMAAAGALGGG